MAKKVEVKATEVQTAKEVQTEVKAEKARVQVKAIQFLKNLSLDWILERPIEDGDVDMLNAEVKSSEDGTEWASWFTQYVKVDGTPVPGISWGISAPTKGGFLILRLLDGGAVKATLRVWPSGKGVLQGTPEIVRALSARPDLPEWSDQDTASLL